jgi:predicted HD superfamily hydrolase involved in NAD metabolism
MGAMCYYGYRLLVTHWRACAVDSEALRQARTRLQMAIPQSRYEHSRRVEEESMRLAARFGADLEVCATAGLLHDCARDLPLDRLIALWHRLGLDRRGPDPIVFSSALLHGPVGALIACEEYGVCDPRVQSAISRHRVGAVDMTLEDKVVCLADYTEPGRCFPGVDSIRNLAQGDLDAALICALGATIKHLVDSGALIDADVVVIRNDLLRRSRMMPKAGDTSAS